MFLYALSNESSPSVYSIGFTYKNLQIRKRPVSPYDFPKWVSTKENRFALSPYPLSQISNEIVIGFFAKQKGTDARPLCRRDSLGREQ